MKIHIACGMTIRENEEKVIRVLETHDEMPTFETLMEETGLSEAQLKRSLVLIRQQMSMAAARKRGTDFV